MHSASTNEVLMSAACPGNSRISLSLQRRTEKRELSLMSFSREQDDQVLFDSKQLPPLASDCLIKLFDSVYCMPLS